MTSVDFVRIEYELRRGRYRPSHIRAAPIDDWPTLLCDRAAHYCKLRRRGAFLFDRNAADEFDRFVVGELLQRNVLKLETKCGYVWMLR